MPMPIIALKPAPWLIAPTIIIGTPTTSMIVRIIEIMSLVR